MIQAVNSVNTNSYKKQNTSFGNKAQAEICDYRPEEFKKQRKHSKAKAFAAYTTAQFAAGAVISSLLNVGRNVIEVLKKVPDKTNIVPAKGIAIQAALMGGLFVLMGLVIDGTFSLMYRNKNKN